MKQWVGLGKFLAGHMQVIVPICVALGVLFPQQIGVLKPIVPTLFAFMTFQGALSNTFHQVAEVFRRPLHLILALLVSAGLLLVAQLLGFGPLRTGRTGRTLGTGGTTLGSLLT